MDRVKRIWYFSPMRAAKVQASLRIRAVSPEPSLLAHTNSESRGTLRQKSRSLAQLNGWAYAVEICHDGMLEDTNTLDGAQMIKDFTIHFYSTDCVMSNMYMRGYADPLLLWFPLNYLLFFKTKSSKCLQNKYKMPSISIFTDEAKLITKCVIKPLYQFNVYKKTLMQSIKYAAKIVLI